MFLLRMMRFLRGYVAFSVTGGFVERFLNLCARSGVAIWGGRRVGGKYTGYVFAREYKKMRVPARTAGVKLRCGRRYGAPFLRFRYRKRFGLLVGLVIFVVIFGVLSRFVWSIEVVNNKLVEEYVILENLSQLGVRVGSRSGDIDARDVERQMLMAVPELSWIAVNIHGSSITVRVSERTVAPDPVDVETPYNVVAAQAGQIKVMEVYQGQAVVGVGDAVLEGELLVSGLIDGRTGSVRMSHARARVIAEMEDTVELTIPYHSTQMVPTGQVIRRTVLHMGPISIPLYIATKVDEPYMEERAELPVEIWGIRLPITTTQILYLPLQETQVTYTEEEAQQLAQEQIEVMERVHFGDCEIMERTAAANGEGDAFHITYHYLYRRDIAQEVEILTE